MLNNLKIGARLGLGFGVILLLLCGVAGIGSYQSARINDSAVDLAESWLPSVQLLGNLRAEANGIRRSTLRHVLEVEKAGKDAQASAHDDLLVKKVPATLAAYEKVITSPKESKLYERIKSKWTSYLEQDKKLIALSNNGAANFNEARRFVLALRLRRLRLS